MADFDRLPDDLDELGISILQSYLDHETTRAQPSLQEVFDTCAGVLNAFREIDDAITEDRPNIFLCMQLPWHIDRVGSSRRRVGPKRVGGGQAEQASRHAKTKGRRTRRRKLAARQRRSRRTLTLVAPNAYERISISTVAD